MNSTAPLTLADRFVMALEGLYAAVAARYRSVGWTVAMIWAVCNRIRRVERRVLRLLDLFRAGMLPPEPALVRRSRAGEARAAGGGRVRLPQRFAWLLAMAPGAAANFASQLRLVLQEPDMAALLAASPKARRAMQTLCHMLAIEPEVIAPKPVTVGTATPTDAAKAPTEEPIPPPPDPPTLLVDFRYFRDGTLPHGPPPA